jgi:hypothetical protein
MADTQDPIVKKTWKAWRARRVLTIHELARLLGSSLPTARRRLKTWNSLTSYNKNGRYYVLPDVPQFDAHGLWHYRDIGFSQYGNLTETLIQLVHQSEAGLSASELGELLRLNPRSFLWLFRNHPELTRDRREGRYVYFAATRGIYRQQKDLRVTMDASGHLPSNTNAVAILVQTIKHPEFDISQLCAHLKRQQIAVSKQDIMNLFAHHELNLKKTRRSPS